MRWRLKLEEYQFTIYFKPRVNNTYADALSRIQLAQTRSSKFQKLLDTPEILESQMNQTLKIISIFPWKYIVKIIIRGFYELILFSWDQSQTLLKS